MSVLQKLTEGIVNRDLSKDGAALLEKWGRTGLLEGLDTDHSKNNMAVLLENQAKELLRETTTMAGGDVEGFAAVAFPLVRRVFAGLIANQLVSVQPMSLPSGLIFFLDFTKEMGTAGDYAAGNTRDGLVVGGTKPSIYGGNKVGSQITGGVDLSQADPSGFAGLRQGFSAARGAAEVTGSAVSIITGGSFLLSGSLEGGSAKLLRYDPDLMATTTGSVAIVRIATSNLGGAAPSGHPLSSPANSWNRVRKNGMVHVNLTDDDSSAITTSDTNLLASAVTVVRRLTKLVTVSGTEYLELVLLSTTDHGLTAGSTLGHGNVAIEFAMDDNVSTKTDGGGALVGASAWEMENSKNIPEINIKVDSVPVTSTTRKLKAHWSPELAQDLNAYHNLDAEVELTGILSEEIALEIDQEIQNDLIRGATAATYYWSRLPGKFVKKSSGDEEQNGGSSYSGPPDFTGTVSEWYETLIETVNDVSAEIHRKTLRGGANFIVTSPEVANIMEFTSGFRAKVTHDDDKGSAGAVNVGSVNNKFEVFVNPYFPRNLILVGRKGSSFLESGYVYAPYVPLQTTPTVFDPENFTPRKAVMTRYGKKMVRPDMYGLVVVQDLAN
jgi:hypothetical protein